MTRKTDNDPACRKERGFSTLEALIALALLAAAFLPLLSLQSQLVRTVIGIETASERAAAEYAALEYLERLNPMLTPRGETQIGDVMITWTAQPVTPLRPMRSIAGISTRFDMQVYRVDVRIRLSQGREASFSIRRLGWRPRQPLPAN